MANTDDNIKEFDTGFTLVQRKNMKRGKPPQQIYRPGSGPLRKSNTFDESESDNIRETNLVKNPVHHSARYDYIKPVDSLRHKSDGNLPTTSAKQIDTEIDKAAARIGDISLNKDLTKRPKKPEQMLYVPRALAQAREISASQDSNPKFFTYINGNKKTYESKDDYGARQKPNMERRRNDHEDVPVKWKDQSAPNIRRRQGSEPRDGPMSIWNRTRDTRSVEPSNSNYNEKIQSKPPSGRRHSSVGLEQERRKMNYDNLPPRLKKKYLQENNLSEENWEGNSYTFQGHNDFNSPKNPSYHPMNNTYSLSNAQNFTNQNLTNLNMGYHTLPNKGRGRGRWLHDQDSIPGQNYRCMTPDMVRSPSNSRPHTPMGGMRKTDSRPHSPDTQESRTFQGRFNTRVSEEQPRELDKLDYDNQRRYQGHRKHDNSNFKPNYDRRPGRRDDTYWDDRDNKNNRDRGVQNRRDRQTPSRDRENLGRDSRGRRTYHVRDSKDKKRSRSRDFAASETTTKGSRYEDNTEKELDKTITEIGTEVLKISKDEQTPTASLEEPMLIEHHIINHTLDWSEEVELTDKLEAEVCSDAPTRSSSINSLHEISTKSLPPNINNSRSPASNKSKRKNRKKSQNRSGPRESSRSRTRSNRTRQNSTTSIDSRESFKHPQDIYYNRRRPSRDRRESSFDRFRNSSRNPSRDSSWDRQNLRSDRRSESTSENWREEIVRSRQNSEKDIRPTLDCLKNVDATSKKAGVIVLPQYKGEPSRMVTENISDRPKYPETRKSLTQQKSLYDPNNPGRPIVVKSPNSRVSVPGFSDNAETLPPQVYNTDQFGNPIPSWYDESSEEFKTCHYQDLLRDVKRADIELQHNIDTGLLLVNWGLVDQLRQFLKEALEYLLCKSIKFCQTENIEKHFWKLLYYNVIEVTRKAITSDPENKERYRQFLLYLIDEGTVYFEKLLGILEETYDFKAYNFLGENNMSSQKGGLGLIGLALISTQKLFLFLGNLGRYREEVNETFNYGKCRQWYIKSQEINPKNGKPYSQLALLAVYGRRKLDAVYYYVRSLMSSNPVPSAKVKLLSLFEENRRKYENGERKRREERLQRQRLQMKQKESEDSSNAPGSLRKETWIHPEGGKRWHRTTQANPDENDSEEEDLASLSSVEVNKRFVISYLHVHGKLINKVGMETFQESVMQMLKEFRALLQQSPVPLPSNRFLQLLALNMFAIESTHLKDPALQSQPGYRSELQERALIVSLQMFDLILERCITVLRDHLAQHQGSRVDFLPPDGEVLLPAVKVWCDWMLCHTDVWNPPPSTRDFRVKGSLGDAWNSLATFMNLLEQMDNSASETFIKTHEEGYEQIRLPEDSVLNGFTPLMYTYQEPPTYAPKEIDIERAHLSMRLTKLLFFGTEYLCGLEPPVLKLEIDDHAREYVSVVSNAGSRDSPSSSQVLTDKDDVLHESFSEEEAAKSDKEEENQNITSNASSEIRDLLTKKVELEKRKRSQELHMQRVKKILSQSVVSVHIEVRPKYLVPDTNCFINHLNSIRSIAQVHCYTLMVPIVVLSELEGLGRGGVAPDGRHSVDPQHMVKKVANAAKEALDFLKTRHAYVKCVTTKGAIIPSTTFSTEDNASWDCNIKNDDRILTTCLVLCKGNNDQTQDNSEEEPRQLVREVVLLTEDRNLRVKAHARDVPVRELPDFMRWAGLG